jgi:uncharacterized protein (TIGR02284 family)
MQNPSEQSVDKLNSLLRGEISAVETYRQALTSVKTPQLLEQLRNVEQSHTQRVSRLRARITQLGGTPSEGSGVWGAFAKTVEGSAKLLGEKAAIQALEEGEDHGLADYRREREALDPDTRRFVESELLPEQERTHGALSTLKRTLH